MRICIIIFTLISFHNFLFSQKIESIGSGLTMRGTIYDIVVDHDNDLTYVVGDLSAVDGVKMQKVGILENEVWKAIPDTSKLEGTILCAELIEGNLYIGGNFTIGTHDEIKNLAKLENGKWQSLGIKSMSGSIWDLTWFEDELYVTGDFRNINGIINNGIMKYSDHQWEDAGLNSFLNAKKIFVSDDTLFAWGNSFSDHSNHSHTVSFLTNNKWETLPKYFGTTVSISTSCIKYKGDIYSTNANNLLKFDFNTNTWKIMSTVPDAEGNSAILFEHNNALHLVLDNRFYRFTNGNLILMNFQTDNDYYFNDVKDVKSVNGKLLVGGDFIHWDSQSVSLANIVSNNIYSLGKVSSHIAYKTPSVFSTGSSIVEYNDKYVIGGTFAFADDLYSPNIVYWDGANFSPFEVPLPIGVRQLEIFENDLYAIVARPLNGHKLLKYNGTQWIGIETPTDFGGMIIIQNKLFLLARYENLSLDGGPFYLQDNSWHELKQFSVEGLPSWHFYGNMQSYKDGYIMKIQGWPNYIGYLPSDTSDWEVLYTPDIDFDHIVTINDSIFLINEWPGFIYLINNGVIETAAQDFYISAPYFFTIDDRIFFSSANESLYRLNDQSQFEKFNSLGVKATAKINDEKYIIAFNSGDVLTGIERIKLNNLGILTLEPLNASVDQDHHTICLKNYIQFSPKTDHINLKYFWNFEGGVPSTSNDVYPMVKFDEPGLFSASLTVTDNNGDSLIQSVEVIVEDCSISTFRENNYDNHWIMGYEYWTGRGLGGFDFTFPDTILTPRYMSDFELHNGSTVMSDKEGNLQFYSNGISILNMDNEVIVGSECLNSELTDYSSEYFIVNQSVLSLPAVDNDSIYYLFDLDYLSEGYWGVASNLSMTTINMNRNNGKGEVVNCNQLIIDDILLNSTMQACKHRNGTDWWIIVGKYQSEEYYKILLTKNGIESVETANWANYYSSPFSGQSTFSPNGEYFAQIILENQEVSIWKFDNQTGLLSDKQTYTIFPLDEYEYPQGCSFSPDSRFLYVSSLSQLRQIDLCNYEELDVELIDTWNGTYEFIYPLFFGKQMLTPNQKIVVTPYGNGHLSFGLIESPNEKGIDCNFRQHSLQISEHCRNNADVIPVFPHYRNYPSYEGECSGVNTVSQESDNSFFVYPNPVGTSTLLRFSQSTSGDLFNINGQKIFSFSNSDYLDTYSLLPGIYFIKTEFGTQKFVKQ